jgi:hypothetical protein
MTKSHGRREIAVVISATLPSAKYSCSGRLPRPPPSAANNLRHRHQDRRQPALHALLGIMDNLPQHGAELQLFVGPGLPLAVSFNVERRDVL